MKRITFIRHSQLEEPYDDYSRLSYEELDNLSTGKISPGINSNSAKLLRSNKLIDQKHIDIIFHSNATRSKETGVLMNDIFFSQDAKLKWLNELKEVEFNVKDLVTKEEYQNNGLKLIRPRLFEAIIKNKIEGIEDYNSINKRIKSIHQFLKKLKSKDIICITHGFFMRFLYLYFKNETKDFSKLTVKQIMSVPNPSYLEGFKVYL